MMTPEPGAGLVIGLDGAVCATTSHGFALGLAIDAAVVMHRHRRVERMCSRERARDEPTSVRIVNG
jgi:hypothetical protein